MIISILSELSSLFGECGHGQNGRLLFLGGDDADEIFGESYPLVHVLERRSDQVDSDDDNEADVKDGENDKISHHFVDLLIDEYFYFLKYIPYKRFYELVLDMDYISRWVPIEIHLLFV